MGALLALSAVLPACTLLAEFIDATVDPCDGGQCLDATIDAAFDSKVDAAPDVKDAAIDATGACKGKSNGLYCGNNGLPVPIPKDYLVNCHDGGVTLTLCTNGCLAFPKGIPDRCDPCAGRGNGSYCGQSFWPGSENAPFRISCGNGTAIIQENCVNGCTISDGGSVCK